MRDHFLLSSIPNRVICIAMEQYRDTPMDLADASLMAVAERLDQTRVFTLDQHFRIHRPWGTTAFQIVPD